MEAVCSTTAVVAATVAADQIGKNIVYVFYSPCSIRCPPLVGAIPIYTQTKAFNLNSKYLSCGIARMQSEFSNRHFSSSKLFLSPNLKKNHILFIYFHVCVSGKSVPKVGSGQSGKNSLRAIMSFDSESTRGRETDRVPSTEGIVSISLNDSWTGQKILESIGYNNISSRGAPDELNHVRIITPKPKPKNRPRNQENLKLKKSE